MKILMLATGMGLGGAEIQICSLANQMHNQGHELHIAWLTGEADVEIPLGVKPHPFRINKTPIGFVQGVCQLRRLIKALEPDVVHAHMVHANLMARITRLITSIKKLICTAHSSNEGGKLLMLAYRFTDRLTDITTHVSAEAAELFIDQKACPPKRLIVVNNGIDTERFAPNPGIRNDVRQALNLSGKTVIITVGRLEHPKNQASLIRAFATLTTTTSAMPSSINSQRLHLVIVGDGSLREDLENLAVELQLADRVSFLGVRRDIPDLLNAADLFVLPSIFEGSPLVVAEALASQVQVVATAVSGVKSLVQGFGTIVPTNDDAALGDGVRTALANDPVIQETKNISARNRVVEQYSIQSVTQRCLAIYSDQTRFSDHS